MSTSEKKRKAAWAEPSFPPDLAECPFCGHPASSEPWHEAWLLAMNNRLVEVRNEWENGFVVVVGSLYGEGDIVGRGFTLIDAVAAARRMQQEEVLEKIAVIRRTLSEDA